MFLNANASPKSNHAVPDSLDSLQNFACKKVEFNFTVWFVGNKSYNNLFSSPY